MKPRELFMLQLGSDDEEELLGNCGDFIFGKDIIVGVLAHNVPALQEIGEMAG
jgi:hypothetical protein